MPMDLPAAKGRFVTEPIGCALPLVSGWGGDRRAPALRAVAWGALLVLLMALVPGAPAAGAENDDADAEPNAEADAAAALLDDEAEGPPLADLRVLAEGWGPEPADADGADGDDGDGGGEDGAGEDGDEGEPADTIASGDFPEDWDVTWPAGWRVEHYHGSHTPTLTMRPDPENRKNHIGVFDNGTYARALLADESFLDATQRVNIRWPFPMGAVINEVGLFARYRPGEEIEAFTDDAAKVEAPALYRAILVAEDGSLRLQRIVDGSVSDLAVAELPGEGEGEGEPLAWEADRWYTLRFDVRQAGDETELRAKLWPRGETEPEAWTVRVTDETPELQHRAGGVGIDGRTVPNRLWWLDDYVIEPGGDEWVDGALRVRWTYDAERMPAVGEAEAENENENADEDADTDADVAGGNDAGEADEPARATFVHDAATRELRLELTAEADLVGRSVSVHAEERQLAAGVFEAVRNEGAQNDDAEEGDAENDDAEEGDAPAEAERARASLVLPRPPYGERWGALEARLEDADTLALQVPENLSHEHASQLAGTFRALEDSHLHVQLADDGETVRLPLEALSESDRRIVARMHNVRARQSPPDWLEGYRVRYKLTLTESLLDNRAETVTVTLPTGGWLNDHGDDIAVVASDGTELPVVVLSHDPVGDTTIQFRKYQYDDVYWVYAINPDAEPGELAFFDEDPETLREQAEEAVLRMMAAQREAGELTGERRDLAAEVESERETLEQAEAELAEWRELLPERVEEHEAASEALEEAEAAHEEAAEAHEEPGRIAEEKSAEARRLTRAARTARSEAEEAEAAHEAAKEAVADARAEAEAAEAAHARAEARQEAAAEAVAEAEREAAEARAAAEAEDLDENERAAAERRAERAEAALAGAREEAAEAEAALEAAEAELAAAPERIEQAEQAVDKTAAAVDEALAAAEAAEAEAEPAEEAARQARLDAAPTASALEEAEDALDQARSRANRTESLVDEARERIAELEQIQSDAEAALAELEPELEPVAEAAEQAQQRAREAAAEAEQLQAHYEALAYEADPRVFREGLTVEYREWEGDTLGDWPAVVEGLERSETITDNAIVASVYQGEKLFRTSETGNFAASYRGYLEVDESGIYSFFVNTEDTVFLFINGYLAYSRTGTNERITGRVPTFSVGADMQLEAGVHTLEVHHVVGHTLGATGRGMMLWIPPGEESWSIVPESAFPRSALAVPVGLEAADCEPVAYFDHGVDDTLRADGMSLYLTRFEAAGEVAGDRLEWAFEDGTRRAGRSLRHIFFEEGDTTVALDSHPDVPPFRRRAHITEEPNPPGPHALGLAVEAIGAMALDELPTAQLNDAYHFLRICDQANRWPVMERVARELLSREGIDLKHRALLYGSLMRALAHQGHGSDAVALMDEALAAVAGVRTLRAQVMLDVANIQRDVLRDFDEADALYERIIVENSRLRHPIVREAAVAWGDLYLDAGDRAQAGEAYRMARRLGRVGAGATAADPVERGALLRVAEQQLQQDDARQSRRMLRRIEHDYPEEKLDGLYRFLRAEADRHGGDYEQAIRHYEVVTQLSEWSSYHPHALHGIADSYYRMGEFAEALDWYAVVENRHPQVYFDQRLDEEVAVIRDRLEQLADTERADDADAGDRLFTHLSENFEATSERRRPDAATLNDAPPLTMGFDGPGTYMVHREDGEVTLPAFELEHLPSQGSLWVEFWYRSRLGDTTTGAHRRYTEVSVYDGEDERLGHERFYFPRTFGRWRKVAFEFDAPRTHDGRVAITLRCGAELLEIDSVQIKHVGDGLNNAMRRFLEGAEPN